MKIFKLTLLIILLGAFFVLAPACAYAESTDARDLALEEIKKEYAFFLEKIEGKEAQVVRSGFSYQLFLPFSYFPRFLTASFVYCMIPKERK